MKNIASENLPLFIAGLILLIALVVWLIYRNLKDKKKYEQNMNNPMRDFEKHESEDQI